MKFQTYVLIASYAFVANVAADVVGTLTFSEIECYYEENSNFEYYLWGPLVDEDYTPYQGFDFCPPGGSPSGSYRVFVHPVVPNGRFFLAYGGDGPPMSNKGLTTHGEYPVTMYRDELWDFHEFRVNSVWCENLFLTITASGYEDEPLYSVEVNLGSSGSPELLTLNWTGIQSLKMVAHGGRNLWWNEPHPGDDRDICFDDFKFAHVSCPSDVNHDVWVNSGDILFVMAEWGPVADNNPADIDNDGFVGVNDLLSVINSWGFCID